MSVAEQAIADSRRILEAGLLDIFFPDASGNVLAASNADFYNAFLNLVGGGEAYRNRDGSVRQNLSPRIRAAVLAAMLNPERRETVERLLDNPEGYNALINGLMQSAANLAELANKPEYDLSGELSQAVELFVETRDKGQTVDEFAAQTDMFREAPSAETMFLMRLFEENAKSSGGISGVLRQYAAECKKIDTTTQSLFGDENPTKLEKLEEAYSHYAADLSSEAGNGNLRWRDTGEPAAEEISEAQKQYEEVKSKYMGTPLWMKAPNGKRTNLTEEQWIEVRTPNFKRWFGDWEKKAWAKAAMDFLEKTAPVRELSGGEFQKDGVKLTEKVPAYFKSIGNVAHNDELGDVVLDLKGVEDSIAHGIGRLKSAAFMAVPDVIEKGFIFNREENWKERGWNTAVIVAPIKLGEDDYVCEVVVKKVRGQQRFYLHEVEIKKTLDGVFKSVANNGNASQVSKLILGKHLAEVKGNVSKVLDENGEPKVVYHGSPYYGFTIFKNESYFTGQKNYAARYKKGGNNSGIYDVFLDIKNPFDTRSKREREIFEKEFYRKWGNGAPLTERGLPDWTDGSDLLEFIEEKGYNYDGIILDEGADGGYGETVSFRGESYVPLNSTQIKSATDNIGTYSENPDIRWRIDDDEVLERIKSLSSADIEGIMDEAERVVSDNLKESKGRSAAKLEADREKYIRDNMSKWEEGGDEDFRYYRNPKAYEIYESGGEYKVEDDDGNELDFFTELEDAKRYALERRWEDDVYDELDYKEDLYEDNPQNAMRKQFEYALRKIGIEIVNSTGGTFNGSEYIYLELPNGEEKKIRFADHRQVYSADMSVEEDWRAAFKFFVERVQREDWTEENYPDNIRWKIDDPSPERIEKLRADKWAENPKNVEMAAKKYLSRFGEGQIIVDPDEIRKLVPNYDVSDISAFVAAGDEILEVVWAAALKRTPKDKPVVLLTGNPATGKGTAIKLGHLNEVSNADLVFDAPQNKFTSVEKRVKEAVYAGHRVFIIQIYNDPITSWRNSLKRGIGKDNPKTGKREGGRFLPLEYFVRVYESAQGKVEKIENILKQNYKDKLETKYIDNTGNNPIVVSPDEALAWDYSISDDQLKEIEGITDEYRGRIEESARLRGDKKDPLAVIRGGVSQVGLDSFRVSSKGISRRTESGDERDLSKSNSGGETRLKALLRQERSENPVIWASIVLAKQILLGRAITSARLDRVLPPERFDGTKREYAVSRAREIAERYRADKEKFGNDLNLGVQRAENDLYWTRDVVEEMYASFRRDGEEYGIARQRLMEWLKEQRRRDLETVKGLSSEELGIDVPAAIEDALEKEPERRKPGENTAEESGGETFEASGEGIDAEIESAREKPAPSSIRDIIGKIRAGVTKAAKARGMDEAARRRAYRNTLAEVLRESAKRLTYGREREAIMKKISDLSAKGYSVIKIKDGERAGQKIDNYTLRAEHIALRIFNRGVRDTKRELSEKFEKIVSRKGKKPSRMERDDKRALAGAAQMRVYNIKRYSEMDAAELEAEYSATVDRLENVEKNFAERIRHYGAFAKAISKEIRKRAAIVQYGLPPFPDSDTIQYRPLCGQSKRRKREQKSSNPKMRCITCESDKTLARLISIKLDLSLYASAPDSYCHASLAA
ncbi:MAG: hypothetical protein BHW65_05170 [Verrucomicrobia bacterium CAG:312_58_20]|nr:MAG: hypothetical protein BHW65_05170 [Verrucomicrobia bacterium CAG:312_58_20]